MSSFHCGISFSPPFFRLTLSILVGSARRAGRTLANNPKLFVSSPCMRRGDGINQGHLPRAPLAPPVLQRLLPRVADHRDSCGKRPVRPRVERLRQHAGCAVLIFLTSINYWRHPVVGLRRTFDMLSSAGCFLYQLRASTAAPAGACATYCGTSTGIVCCYAVSRRYNFALGNPTVGCRWHLMLHMCTGIGSVVLYDALGRNRAGWRSTE